MGEFEALTLERARELSDRLEAARKESEALRTHLEEYWRRTRMLFWPERRRNVVGSFNAPLPDSSNDAV
jgi:hypothetical protein